MPFDPPAELAGLGTACLQLVQEIHGEVRQLADGEDLLKAFVVGLAA